MRKNFVKRFLAIAGAVGLLFGAGCQLDLSHKHFLNDYGVCGPCQKDLSVALTKNSDGVYRSESIATSQNWETIVKFVGNGEQGISLVVECEDAVVQRVKFYSEEAALIDSMYMMDQTSPRQTHEFSFDYNLENGVTYYLCFTLNVGGNIKLSIFEN